MMALAVPDAFDVAGIGPPIVVAVLLAFAAALGLARRNRLRMSRALLPADCMEDDAIGEGMVGHVARGGRKARSSPDGRGSPTMAGGGLRDTAM